VDAESSPDAVSHARYQTRALFNNTTANYNTASGTQAMFSNTTGEANLADGALALYSNTTGAGKTGVGANALYSNTTSNYVTCVGYSCTASDSITNATAIGSRALVEQSNSLVLGGTGDHAVNVGIGTTKPSNILTIARGAGHPVSDSWETYSSRRWKTNIKTLPDALRKVEQLRGVSNDLKDSGKHEIGVIAEEVGAVVPEVVSFEENGKDARAADYSRLTALLIEATKEQQTLIHQQQREITRLRSQVKSIQAVLKNVTPNSSQVRTVKAELVHR
jgi:trimeric autotransporter adhesin